MEEALDSTGSGKENTEQMKEMIGEFFEQGTEVYKGEGNSLVVQGYFFNATLGQGL